MDGKLTALKKVVGGLEDLQKGIKGETLDSAALLTQKINKVATSLAELYEAGRSMEGTSMMEIPLEMLSFIDEDVSNPELYQYKAMEDYEAYALKLSERLDYLQNIEKEVDKHIAGGGSSSCSNSGSSSSSSGGGGGGGGGAGK